MRTSRRLPGAGRPGGDLLAARVVEVLEGGGEREVEGVAHVVEHPGPPVLPLRERRRVVPVQFLVRFPERGGGLRRIRGRGDDRKHVVEGGQAGVQRGEAPVRERVVLVGPREHRLHRTVRPRAQMRRTVVPEPYPVRAGPAEPAQVVPADVGKGLVRKGS
nr:hypothetical protein [Streptomyces viridosporus]